MNNNYNLVFQVVKEVCGEKHMVDSSDSFATISKKTGVHPYRLSIYLDTLESMGLMFYNAERGYIKLTELGIAKDVLFI